MVIAIQLSPEGYCAGGRHQLFFLVQILSALQSRVEGEGPRPSSTLMVSDSAPRACAGIRLIKAFVRLRAIIATGFKAVLRLAAAGASAFFDQACCRNTTTRASAQE